MLSRQQKSLLILKTIDLPQIIRPSLNILLALRLEVNLNKLLNKLLLLMKDKVTKLLMINPDLLRLTLLLLPVLVTHVQL